MADRTAAPAALEGAEPSSARRFRNALAGARAEVALATVAIEAEALLDRLAELDGDALTEAGARDYHGHVAPVVARLRAALLTAALADPAPAAPAPGVEAPPPQISGVLPPITGQQQEQIVRMMTTDTEASRQDGFFQALASFGFVRSYTDPEYGTFWTLTDKGRARASIETAFRQPPLTRLGAARPADSARASLGGAVREAAPSDAALDRAVEVFRDCQAGDVGLREAIRQVLHHAALAAEPDAGDGWERITDDTSLVDREPWIVGRAETATYPAVVGEARWCEGDEEAGWWWAGESPGEQYGDMIVPAPTHRRPLPAPPAPRTGREA